MTTNVSGTLTIDGAAVPFTGALSQDAPQGPTGPTGPPGTGGGAVSSPTVIVAPSTSTFGDAAGNAWGINAAGQVTMNGIADTTTSGVAVLTLAAGTVWQENSSKLWWGKASATAAWLPVGGTSVSPLGGGFGPTGPPGPVGPTGPGIGATGPTGAQGAPGSALALSSHTTSYTLAITDANTIVAMNGTNLTLTIPANAAVPIGVPTLITVINESSTPLSIAIGTDKLILAGTTSAGTRTVAPNGICTLVKSAPTLWYASGAGVK
jgi:hypothetical protein